MSHTNTWSGLSEEQDKKWEQWEDAYVPSDGTAETIGGEIIRAMDRLLYRWFNDGDRVGVGYGNETCNSSERYIFARIPHLFNSLDDESLSDVQYERILLANHRKVFHYLETNPDAFERTNYGDSRTPSHEDLRRMYDWDRENYDDYDEE